jgi:hypothetical protein
MAELTSDEPVFSHEEAQKAQIDSAAFELFVPLCG